MFIRGTHRYVFVIGPIVLKIPIIDILWALKLYIKAIKSIIFYDPNKWPPIMVDTIKHSRTSSAVIFCEMATYCLTEGILENYRDIECYYTAYHRLLVPLYLPLLFVNVYRRVDGVGDIEFETYDWWQKEEDSKEYRKAVYSMGHTFDLPKNFAYDGKRVWIVDYGEKGMQKLLPKYGDLIEARLLAQPLLSKP